MLSEIIWWNYSFGNINVQGVFLPYIFFAKPVFLRQSHESVLYAPSLGQESEEYG